MNEKVIRTTADAIASNGMRGAGCEHVVMDDCWHGTRDANGFITENCRCFPSGPKALGDHVHAKGAEIRHLFGRRHQDLWRAVRQPGA